MTTTDWWTLIADYTRAGDWNGVLVAADALEELGDAETAAGLRWAIQKTIHPTLSFVTPHNFEFWVVNHFENMPAPHPPYRSFGTPIEVWRYIVLMRSDHLRYWQ